MKKGFDPLMLDRCASNVDQKGIEALDIANELSIEDNLEYGGFVYQADDGSLGFTNPTQGTDQGWNPNLSVDLVPEGVKILAVYHTHGDYSLLDPTTGQAIRTSNPLQDDFNSDHFSRQDRLTLDRYSTVRPGVKGYLGTPSGIYKAYDTTDKSVYRIK